MKGHRKFSVSLFQGQFLNKRIVIYLEKIKFHYEENNCHCIVFNRAS